MCRSLSSQSVIVTCLPPTGTVVANHRILPNGHTSSTTVGSSGEVAPGKFEGEETDTITLSPYPGHIVTWRDTNTTQRVTVRLVLPSGCGPDDIHASIVQGGMAVEITYAWPEILLDAMGLYDMYTNDEGDELYPDDSGKILGFKARMNEVRSNARFTAGRPQSTYMIPLPFQVQERFTDVVTPRGTHRGTDIVNHFDDVTGSEIFMLNLEMTCVHTGNDAKREARIPIRLDRHKSKKSRQTHQEQNGHSLVGHQAAQVFATPSTCDTGPTQKRTRSSKNCDA